jgi:hypothetical protein
LAGLASIGFESRPLRHLGKSLKINGVQVNGRAIDSPCNSAITRGKLLKNIAISPAQN